MIRRFSAFSDNYIWGVEFLQNIVLVDPGESGQILRYLGESTDELAISAILVTHRHHDHVGGIFDLLRSKFANSQVEVVFNGLPITNKLAVFGPKDCQKYGVEFVVSDGDTIKLDNHVFEVVDIPGHTEEHVGYFYKSQNASSVPAFFCGDTLFGAGCGRVLGGNIEELYQSLKKIAKLPQETLIYCAHEYTEMNLKFAKEFFPKNEEIRKIHNKS